MSIVMQHAVNDTIPEINFSESVIKHLVSYLQKNAEYKGVRLSVKKTGCSGLSYVVDYVLAPVEGDLVIPLNESYLVCIDKSSYPFLQNMNVDYVKQGLNFKFIFNNPNQTGQCGCGESFTVG
ncbi:MAG: iron-sulfur cluster assembly accessory protein [Legionella sp.]|nr:iron-sulfur cluster assembly accessory protein [Legionella sp.]